jgi:hypothetical protein
MMHDDNDDLDLFFDAARRADDLPLPVGFLARVEAQAIEEQPTISLGGSENTASPGPLAQLLAAIGSWPAMAGLATAGIAGLWIGIAPPAALATMAGTLPDGVTGSTSDGTADDLYLVDAVPGFAFSLDLTEGS